MTVLITWIISAVVSAWALISGATAIAGAGLLSSALALMPGVMGTAPATWLNIANWYAPLNETVALMGVYFVIAGAMKFLKLSSILKRSS